MSNNTVLSTNVGSGDTINTTDCTTFTAISTTGKMPGSLIFTSTATNAPPAAVIDTRPLPVCIRNATGTTLGDATTPLKVDGSASTQPVSGTFWQATQPVSAAALPLPTGASIAAKQPALGTAGTASTDVITVQGIASMTALKVDGSSVTQPVSGTVSITANSAINVAQINGVTPLMGNGITGTGSPRVTVASDNTPFIVKVGDNTGSAITSTNGALDVNIHGASVSGVAVTQATGTNLHAVIDSGTITTVSTVTAVTTVSTVTNLSQMGGNAISMGTGVRGPGVQRVTICTDDVVPASQSGTWTVQPGNTPNTSAWLTQPTAGTANGASISCFNSTASNNLTAVKSSAGNVYSIIAINTTATLYYLKLFDGTPTMGTTIAIGNIPIPANTSGAGVVIQIPVGLSFATNINVALTGAIALNDNTSAAIGVCVNVIYK